MKPTITLGGEYRDKITKFQGVCTGTCFYLTGCNQALLVPKVGKDGAYIDSQWFDFQRLEPVGKVVIALDNGTTPGCDKQAPKR